MPFGLTAIRTCIYNIIKVIYYAPKNSLVTYIVNYSTMSPRITNNMRLGTLLAVGICSLVETFTFKTTSAIMRTDFPGRFKSN